MPQVQALSNNPGDALVAVASDATARVFDESTTDPGMTGAQLEAGGDAAGNRPEVYNALVAGSVAADFLTRVFGAQECAQPPCAQPPLAGGFFGTPVAFLAPLFGLYELWRDPVAGPLLVQAAAIASSFVWPIDPPGF